jgi:hypothetical protein
MATELARLTPNQIVVQKPVQTSVQTDVQTPVQMSGSKP